MRKFLMTALTLSLTVASAAPLASVTYTDPAGTSMAYQGLYTESGWQAVTFDLRDADLQALSDLGDGEINTDDLSVELVTVDGNGEALKNSEISLSSLNIRGQQAFAQVEIDRNDRSEGVHARVTVKLKKGDMVIAERDVMVYGAFSMN